MKKLFFAAALIAVSLSSCGGGGSASLKSESDTLAYAMGVAFGMQVKEIDSTMNVNVLAAGIKDVISGKQKLTYEQGEAFFREYFTVRIPAKNKAAADEFIQSVEKSNPNIVKTESGLLYEILAAGDDNVKATNDADQVRVLYKGMLKDGTEFDSNIRTLPDGTVSADTVTFALNQVIPGWSEGMKYVGKGGKIKLYVPSDLGYGANAPYGSSIKPNDALVFEVELIDVIPTTEVAE